MSGPFFSIIIPTYNRAVMIGAALGSIRQQIFQDYEVIIADDGSTDDTVQRIEQARADFPRPIHLLRQQNAGPGAARNIAIARANGQYAAFLDSDDLWLPWTLKNYHSAIMRTASPGFVVGRHVDLAAGIDGSVAPEIADHPDFFSLQGVPFYEFTTSSVAMKLQALREAGGFAAGRINYEDLDLWMRMGIVPGFAFIQTPPSAIRRLHGQNISGSREHNIRGAMYMIATETAGKYPGGSARRRDRVRLLGNLMRAASFAFVRQRQWGPALQLYRATLSWNLASLRLRYLFGFPAILLDAVVRRKP